jgi:hypothetical protein
MFWKYIFPLLLCFFLAWFIRKFLCTKEYRRDAEECRIPRLWMILLMACGFIPIANYIVFGFVLILIIIVICEGDLYLRDKPFKNEKFQNWLMKN